MSAARRTPLIAALPKMLFPFLVIFPGLIALALTRPAQDRSSSFGESSAIKSAEVVTVQESLIAPQVNVETGQVVQDKEGKPVLDYNTVIPRMLLHYFPSGMLGLGLTALLASFMSGMAGNVTAFNTVCTYDIYRAYIRKDENDQHYLKVARFMTVLGVALSVGAAYFAAAFNNIMDVLQLVFAFVNAPLFATFLLGMFWKRATGHGAFFGLLSGIAAAAVHHGLTIPEGSVPGIKGGWIAVVNTYSSEMAQNFWTAIFAWTTCFLVTIVISLATKPRPDNELKGLVYALTERQHDDSVAWYKRPVVLGLVVLGLTLLLNVIFF
jgi:SSS family solute:Na+ symporter